MADASDSSSSSSSSKAPLEQVKATLSTRLKRKSAEQVAEERAAKVKKARKENHEETITKAMEDYQAKLQAHRKDPEKVKKPSIRGMAEKHGLHVSTLNRRINIARDPHPRELLKRGRPKGGLNPKAFEELKVLFDAYEKENGEKMSMTMVTEEANKLHQNYNKDAVRWSKEGVLLKGPVAPLRKASLKSLRAMLLPESTEKISQPTSEGELKRLSERRKKMKETRLKRTKEEHNQAIKMAVTEYMSACEPDGSEPKVTMTGVALKYQVRHRY
jgi:hypothetical protein